MIELMRQECAQGVSLVRWVLIRGVFVFSEVYVEDPGGTYIMAGTERITLIGLLAVMRGGFL